ncbi:MAG: arylsulfatase, partial [Kiritimatiellia bacterium]
GGHRIPYVMRWPAAIPAGSVCDQTFCLTDLMATMAEITGYSLPDNAAEDSVSTVSLWDGSATGPIREAVVHHSINGSFSIRKGKWKLEMCADSGGWSVPRCGHPEERAGLPPVQLYDLSVDIGERENVQARYPEVVDELRDLLTRYVVEGRSTPGAPQSNTGDPHWKQLWWIPAER